MNIGNILKVADAIENSTVQNLGFNMKGYMQINSKHAIDYSGKDCGTVACIAGWACAIEGVPYEDISHSSVAFNMGAKLFGLSEEEAEELFVPETETVNYYSTDILPANAVRCLRNLAITGKVDWEAAMKDDEPVLPQRPGISPTARLDRLAAKLNQPA